MILILGGSGYVGSRFRRFFEKRGISFVSVSRLDADYGNPERLEEIVEQVQPEFLVNCAGYTGRPNVDGCEDHRWECLQANAVLPGVIDEVCRKRNLPWGHVTSGCIFSGRHESGRGFVETDLPNFSFRGNRCSFYSGSKALGEEAIGFGQRAGESGAEWGWLDSERECGVYVWRLRMPFSEIGNPRNYLSKLLNYSKWLSEENSLSQIDEFVSACWECRARRAPTGIYHVVNPGTITAREISQLMLAERERRSGTEGANWFPDRFEFFENEAELLEKAARTPRSNCELSPDRLLSRGIEMTEVHEAVERALASWVPSAGASSLAHADR